MASALFGSSNSHSITHLASSPSPNPPTISSDESNILPHFEVTVLSAKDYQDAIHGCATQGWTGGRVYDALHLRAAQKAGCDQIYTFNVRPFQQRAPELANLIRSP